MHEPLTAATTEFPDDWEPGATLPPPDLWSDEPPMESDRHRKQMEILIQSAESWFAGRDDFYATGNLTIYFSPNQRKSEDFRGPDYFLLLGVPRHERRSWIVWYEGGRYPDVIVEILSDSTAAVDRGLKKEIYSRTFRTPEYYLFDPESLELEGWRLREGEYRQMEVNDSGRLWSHQMGVFLGVWQDRLRFFTPEGELVPLPQERAERERLRAEQEQARAEQERERAEQEQARAEQERERAEQEQARAEQERERAEQEQARAEQERERAEQEQARAEQERERALQQQQRAEQEQARAEQERARAEQQQQRAEQERLRAEQEQARAEQQQQRAEQERLRAEQEQARAEQQQQRAEQERLRAEAASQVNERLKERLRALGVDPDNL
jgi:Uma2 family endonuclease